MNSLATTAKQPARRDTRLLVRSLVAAAVTIDFGIAIYRHWDRFAASRYAPLPLILLLVVGLSVPYSWVRTVFQRSAIEREAREGRLDAASTEAALRDLYRRLFVTSMVAFVALFALDQILAH